MSPDCVPPQNSLLLPRLRFGQRIEFILSTLNSWVDKTNTGTLTYSTDTLGGDSFASYRASLRKSVRVVAGESERMAGKWKWIIIKYIFKV